MFNKTSIFFFSCQNMKEKIQGGRLFFYFLMGSLTKQIILVFFQALKTPNYIFEDLNNCILRLRYSGTKVQFFLQFDKKNWFLIWINLKDFRLCLTPYKGPAPFSLYQKIVYFKQFFVNKCSEILECFRNISKEQFRGLIEELRYGIMYQKTEKWM